jgi:hypothetical protein
MAEKTNESSADVAPTAEKMSKVEAVRQSLAKLGNDAKPKAIQADILTRFGIQMTTDHIKTAKGNHLRKLAEGGFVTRKAGRPTGAKGKESISAQTGNGLLTTAVTVPRTKSGATSTIGMDDILTLKGLVERIGVDSLRTLIGVLSK